MESKFLSMTRGLRPSLDVDKIGMHMWAMGVLVIGLSFAIRLDNQSALLRMMVLGALLVYIVGLVLIALGVLDVLRTHFNALKKGQHARLRYARPALFPLWYHVYGARTNGLASLRFDHGQAWAWGTECLIAAGIIETALMLAEQHPLWHQVGTLAVLAVVRVTVQAVREQVVAHGHRSAAR